MTWIIFDVVRSTYMWRGVTYLQHVLSSRWGVIRMYWELLLSFMTSSSAITCSGPDAATFLGIPTSNGYRRFLFAPCAWHSLSLALPTLVPPYSSVPGANVSPPISLSDIIRTPCYRNFVRKQNAPPNKDVPTFIKLVRLPPEEETTKQLPKWVHSPPVNDRSSRSPYCCC